MKLLTVQQTNRQTDRQTDRQIDRQTDRQTDKRRVKLNFVGGGKMLVVVTLIPHFKRSDVIYRSSMSFLILEQFHILHRAALFTTVTVWEKQSAVSKYIGLR